MSKRSEFLRAELAFRIRTVAPADWQEFSNLWMVFNAIYGGQPDKKERSRVMAAIRRSMKERQALAVVRQVTQAVDKLLAVPPGNMMIERSNPHFRAASQRYASMYRNKRESSVGRLATIAAVLYQIRCNLIHGSKDPDIERDCMLVSESRAILAVRIPALEKAYLTTG